jgi:hypothetical protein
LRTSWVAQYQAFDPRIEVGEWCARDPGQFALPESLVRVVALLFAGASFGGSPPGHLRSSRFRAALLASTRLTLPMPTRRALLGWTSLSRLSNPPLTFRRHLRAPLRGSSPRSQLTTRAVAGRLAFTHKSGPPPARPVRSVRCERSETPSVVNGPRTLSRTQRVLRVSGKRNLEEPRTPIRPRSCRRARSRVRRPPSG